MSAQVQSSPEIEITHFDIIRDTAELARMAVATLYETYGHTIKGTELDNVINGDAWEERFILSSLADTILVARFGGDMAGYAQFGQRNARDSIVRPDSKELRKLYVATSLHGTGVGRHLMQKALDAPEMAAAPEIYLWVWGENDRAISFYQKNDFQPAAARHYARIDGTPTHDLMMIREQAR